MRLYVRSTLEDSINSLLLIAEMRLAVAPVVVERLEAAGQAGVVLQATVRRSKGRGRLKLR